MSKGNAIVHVRMDDQTIRGIDEAAETAQIGRSAFCRQLITAAVESGLNLGELCDRIAAAPPVEALADPVGVVPASSLPLGSHRKLTGRCLHPVHQLRRYSRRDVCGVCEQVLRRR